MTATQSPPPSPNDLRSEIERAAPLVWVAALTLLSVRGFLTTGYMPNVSDLPPDISVFLVATFASTIMIILLGLVTLGLAFARSARFRTVFSLWGIVEILRSVMFLAAGVLITGFSQTVTSVLTSLFVIAVTVWTLRLVRRPAAQPSSGMAGATPAAASPAGSAGRPVGTGVLVFRAILGFVIGGAAGLGLGLLAGSIMVDIFGISCFEGGCGYAALAVGVLGLIVGAIAGPIVALVLSRRAMRPA